MLFYRSYQGSFNRGKFVVKWVFSILQNTWKYSVYADNRKLDIKFGTNPNRNLEAPFIKTIEKIWEYEQKIDAKINRLVDLRAAINAAIESMENPEERLLLKYRYLKNESWEDISYDLNVSYRTVHRIHASALNNFVVPE